MHYQKHRGHGIRVHSLTELVPDADPPLTGHVVEVFGYGYQRKYRAIHETHERAIYDGIRYANLLAELSPTADAST